MKYVPRNFLCGLQGRDPSSLNDLNALREWIWGVANQRVHGTTHEKVAVRWDVEEFSLQSLAGQPPYPYVDGELRKMGGMRTWTGKARVGGVFHHRTRSCSGLGARVSRRPVGSADACVPSAESSGDR